MTFIDPFSEDVADPIETARGEIADAAEQIATALVEISSHVLRRSQAVSTLSSQPAVITAQLVVSDIVSQLSALDFSEFMKAAVELDTVRTQKTEV